MLNSGFSDAIGSCRIIAIARPRMRRSARALLPVSSSPSKAMLPPAMRAFGGSSPMMERQVVVLPQPDSPISPSVSPAFSVKLMPSTAFTTRVPPNDVKCVRRSEISRSGVAVMAGPVPAIGSGSVPPMTQETALQIPLLRIQPDAQPVAEQLRRQHDQQDAEPREYRQPPV